jgi:hypothetical protein
MNELPPCPVCKTNKAVCLERGHSTLLCGLRCYPPHGGCGETSGKQSSENEAIAPWTEAAKERAKLEALAWSDQENERRCELIDIEETEGALSKGEKAELKILQDKMLAYRRTVAPLPIKQFQSIHLELKFKALAAKIPKLSKKLPDEAGPWWWQKNKEELPIMLYVKSWCNHLWAESPNLENSMKTTDMGGYWAKALPPELPEEEG